MKPTKDELIDILTDHPDLNAIGCVVCGGCVESFYKEWKEPRPFGSTVAMETCGETTYWCHKCQSEDTAAPILKEVLEAMKERDGLPLFLHKGHLLWLAEVMEAIGEG
jgi:hypothetical protein